MVLRKINKRRFCLNKFIGIYSKQEKSFCIIKVKNVFHKILIIKYLCEYFCDRNLMLQKSKEKNPKNFHLRKTKHRKNTMMIELPEIKLNKEDHKNNKKNKSITSSIFLNSTNKAVEFFKKKKLNDSSFNLTEEMITRNSFVTLKFNNQILKKENKYSLIFIGSYNVKIDIDGNNNF